MKKTVTALILAAMLSAMAVSVSADMTVETGTRVSRDGEKRFTVSCTDISDGITEEEESTVTGCDCGMTDCISDDCECEDCSGCWELQTFTNTVAEAYKVSSTRNTTVFKGHSDVRKSVSEITIGLEFKDEDEDANISFAVYANVNEDENQWEKLTIEGCEIKDGEIVLDLECSKSYRDYKVYVYTDDNCELGECEMTYTFHLRSYSDGINPNMLARYSKYMD